MSGKRHGGKAPQDDICPPCSELVEAGLQAGRREDGDTDDICPRCGESRDLAKVKGCIKCLKCGYKFDCNGW